MSLVKYQVERRPIGDDGHVYRGLSSGDYITIKTHHNAPLGNIEVITGDARTLAAKLLGPKDSLPPLIVTQGDNKCEAKTHFREVTGEPWLVHSTHFSIESALESAAPLAAAIGAENVRIVQVLSHTTIFKLQ